jgi:hypothetical protein
LVLRIHQLVDDVGCAGEISGFPVCTNERELPADAEGLREDERSYRNTD